MKAVLLDRDTLGNGIDLSPIQSLVSNLEVYGTTTPDELLSRVEGADILITNKVVISAEAMQGKIGVLVVATGMNNVDLMAAERLGVPVKNVVNYGTDSVAQHCLMLLLALAGRLVPVQKRVGEGAWQESPFFCLLDAIPTQLANKHLVLVGEGTLGKAIGRLAEAFGMQVTFCARPGDKADPRSSLDALLPVADALSFHCPLNESTHHLLNQDRLSRIKPGCLVVNCARGGIIDELAALESLKTGRIGGLAVDVLPQEPPVSGHPLLEALKDDLNLIVTPHSAWSSPEARQTIVDMTAENLKQLLSTDQI